jgi:5-methylcytosine-specific restriction endonuclease McrA
VNKLYTLKLDASWRPIEVVDGFKGFSLVFSGRAQVVENYSQLACALFYFPSVVVLNSYIRKRQFRVSPTRNTIFYRDRYVCQYCRKRYSKSKLTLDHVTPKSRGGDKSWTNLVTSCSVCNQKKADKTPYEANMTLLKEPAPPKNSYWNSPEWLLSRVGNNTPKEWDKFLGVLNE